MAKSTREKATGDAQAQVIEVTKRPGGRSEKKRAQSRKGADVKQ